MKEGFLVERYEHENFETAKFDVETFKKNYDLVIYIGNVENASNKVTNRLHGSHSGAMAIMYPGLWRKDRHCLSVWQILIIWWMFR